MRFEFQERVISNERPGGHIQKVFEVRDGRGGMRVLRSAGLSGDYLLSMPEHSFVRPSETQVDPFVPSPKVTLRSEV